MNKKIVYDFVNAINEHDIEKMCLLMTGDHMFIDAHGNRVTGKDKMKAGWQAYFQWFPDYNIEITDMFPGEETLAAFGFASGTFKGIHTAGNKNYWRLPAAWKIKLTGNRISLWQVYADTKIPFDIIDKNK
ncbi:MAG: nuclear transport factor 2 family protein [Chitinophagales bacterium]